MRGKTVCGTCPTSPWQRVVLLGVVALLISVAWHAAAREIVAAPPASQPVVTIEQVDRVTTAVPFPRGLVWRDGKLYVLARGRVREAGGADGAIDDQAGTIFEVDPEIAEPITHKEVSQRVRGNGKVFATPTSPPFHLLDRSLRPATRDRETDRPYCALRFDHASRNFFLCAFSGIDKAGDQPGYFSKNLHDAILRFDTRVKQWFTVERHDIEKGGIYPHHGPDTNPPPHGWLNGPDNCLVVGRWLYAVAKDNSLLVRYDLSAIRDRHDAPPPPSHWVMDSGIALEGRGWQRHYGHSMLALRDGYLYIGYRTSSTIVRIKLGDDDLPVQPMVGQLIAQFDPYNETTRKSANLTDMAFGPKGDLHVISAQPSRVYRFRPHAGAVYDGRTDAAPPWADLSMLTDNPRMKSENILVDDAGRVYVTSGDAYGAQAATGGTVYRITPAQ